MIDYDSWQNEVMALQVGCDGAEAQGVLLGLLCKNAQITVADWLQALQWSMDLLNEQQQNSIEACFSFTREGLASEACVMQLLLPNDEQSLGERACALRNCVDGFISGLGLSQQQAMQGWEEEAKEAFALLVKIPQQLPADPQEIEDNEEDEAAWVELIEFVRVTMMLIYEQQFYGNNNTQQVH